MSHDCINDMPHRLPYEKMKKKKRERKKKKAKKKNREGKKKQQAKNTQRHVPWQNLKKRFRIFCCCCSLYADKRRNPSVQIQVSG